MRAKASRVLKDPYIPSSRDASPCSYFSPVLFPSFTIKNHAKNYNVNRIKPLEVNR